MVAYPTEVRVVFVLRRSAMIWAPSTFNWLAPKLRRRAESGCHRVLTAGKGGLVTYLTLCSVWLTFSASETCFAPSA